MTAPTVDRVPCPARRRRWPATAAVVAAVVLGGCELQDVTLAEPPEDMVVVEGLVQVGIPAAGFGSQTSVDRISVLLHRTVQGEEGRNDPVPGALVLVRGPGGVEYRLRELLAPTLCVSSTPVLATGTCYVLDGPDLAARPPLRPGDRLELEVQTLDGGRMAAVTTVPGSFELLGPTNEQACVLLSDAPYSLSWSSSQGAWAYVAETQIYGLTEALAPRGIEVEVDPLFLLGLSISAADTTITFPTEFGVFDRFDLQRDVAVALQQGLPPGTWAEVAVAAVDRNYVNWIRGGNFNPSGTVRIPSVQGDGTGFFASALVRWFEVLVNPSPFGGVYTAPPCRTAGAD